MIEKKPSMILIMDGFGINNDLSCESAIRLADTSSLDDLFNKFPMTELSASGSPVGLPDGQMGNSEVGHLNIGSGRIVYQDLLLISNALKNGDLEKNTALNKAFTHVKKHNSTLHLFGLFSDGGVHSHIDHLFGLINLAISKGIEKIRLHTFLDGRDVPPRCALSYFDSFKKLFKDSPQCSIATVSGRYYAMDRDNRWERIEKAYNAITLGEGYMADSPEDAVKDAYERDENDEFVQPSVIQGIEDGTVNDNDSVIFFNFRPDRARELTRTFVDPQFDSFARKKIINNLEFVCMTQYDATMPNVELAFPPEKIKNTLGEYISDLGLNQLRIAETEKYAHVTFFFNGGVEKPNKNEDRILIPSPDVATYDLKPEMSAPKVTEKAIEAIRSDKYDLIILNFANADMVGHTGVMDAAIKAVETVDKCVKEIADEVLKKDGQILLTADHGNADLMKDSEGNIVTSHSTKPVPLVHISNEPKKLADGGKLADIAPTLLDLMGISIPPEMTGSSLVK